MKKNQLVIVIVMIALGGCTPRSEPDPRQDIDGKIQAFYDEFHLRIDLYRSTPTSRETWEKEIELIHEVSSFEQLKEALQGWEIPDKQMTKYKKCMEASSFCGFYGTKGDGRMVIFYDQNQQSFDTWGSWYQFNEFNE